MVDFGWVFDLKFDFASVVFEFVGVLVGKDGLIVLVLVEVFGLEGSDSFGLDSFEESDNLTGLFVVIEVFDGFGLMELKGLVKGF